MEVFGMMVAGMDLSEKLLAGVALFEMKLFEMNLFQINNLFQTVGMIGYEMVVFGMVGFGMVAFETAETETVGKVDQVHFVIVCYRYGYIYRQNKILFEMPHKCLGFKRFYVTFQEVMLHVQLFWVVKGPQY